MATTTTIDRTRSIVRANLERIDLISVAGPILLNAAQTDRLNRILRNRQHWGLPPPLLMLTSHGRQERLAAEGFQASLSPDLARSVVQKQEDHKDAVANAIQLYRREFDPRADVFQAKRRILFLTRRGGKGTPTFISPFVHGHGTTCGAWTRPVVPDPQSGGWARNADGTVIKGFMKAALAIGFCPVECPFCYLQMMFSEGMDIAMNWEDLALELELWQDYPYPVNFGETSGLVEYDEWFARADGEGSMVQYIIDRCAERRVIPFFLTKIRYPRYLKFRGHVQVGISLMPEAVRTWLAPNGSPADELLDGLAWAVSSGARDPVVRLTTLWNEVDHYPALLKRCKERLGSNGWRLTLDILRFTPKTAAMIADRYPQIEQRFAREIDPTGTSGLRELAKDGREEKKIRPPSERQAEIYRWFRDQLNALGCPDVMITPCKGDPDELIDLVREGVIRAMPCACYPVTNDPPASGRVPISLV